MSSSVPGPFSHDTDSVTFCGLPTALRGVLRRDCLRVAVLSVPGEAAGRLLYPAPVSSATVVLTHHKVGVALHQLRGPSPAGPLQPHGHGPEGAVPAGRPLLVLHGTNDRNVPFRDSLRLIDVLVKLGKSFEMGVYPGEIHFFRRAHILRDAWSRAEDFFDRHLKQPHPSTSQ